MILERKNILIILLLALLGVWFTFPSKLKLGILYFEGQKYQEAYNLLNDVPLQEQKNVFALKTLQEYFILNGQNEKALDVQKTLLKLKPHNLDYIKRLQEIFLWVHKPYDSLKIAELKIPLTPEHQKEKLILEIAREYHWIEAQEDANRLFSTLEDSQDTSTVLAVLDHYVQTEQREQTQSFIHHLVIRDNLAPRVREKIAEYYVSIEKYKEAIEEYLILYTGKKDSRALYTQFNFLYENSVNENKKVYLLKILELYRAQGNWKLAVAFQQYLQGEMPQDHAQFMLLVDDYQMAGEINKAVVLLKARALKYQGQEGEILKIAQKLDSMNRLEEALLYYEELEKIRPNFLPYLQNLAKKYEEMSRLKDALRIYYKILNIKKKATSFLLNKPVFLAMNSNQESFLQVMRSTASTGKKTSASRELRLKIADLHDQLGETKSVILILEELLLESPEDLKIIEDLALRYTWLNEEQKARELYRRIYQKNPKHPLGIKYTFLQAIERQDKDLTYKLLQDISLEDLFNFKDSSLLSSVEEILFEKDKEIHNNFCHWEMQKEMEQIKYRCLQRTTDEFKQGQFLQEKIKEDPLNHFFRSEYVAWLLKNKDLDKAKIQLQEMRAQKLWNQWNQEQWDFIFTLEKESTSQNSWVVHSESSYLGFSDYGYVEQLMRFSRPSFQKTNIAFETKWYQGLVGYTKSLQKYSPYLHTPWGGGWDVGYSYYQGDQKPQKVSFFVRTDHNPTADIYYNIVYENAQPVLDILSTIQNRIEKRQLTGYYFQQMNSRFWYDFSYRWANYYKAQEKGSDHQFNLESYWNIKNEHWFWLGYRLALNHLQSNSALISSIFIKDSLAQYIVLQGLWKSKKEQGSEFRLKSSFGADTRRNIDFGKTYILEADYKYRVSPFDFLRLLGSFSTETAQFYSAQMIYFKLELSHQF